MPIKNIAKVSPAFPFEAYSHIVSPIDAADGGGFLFTMPDIPGVMADIPCQLAWPILGEQHCSGIRRGLLLEASATLNLARGTAGRLLENLRSRAVQEAETLVAEVEAENTRIRQLRPELSAKIAGEVRCIRAILHTVLKEMVKQVA